MAMKAHLYLTEGGEEQQQQEPPRVDGRGKDSRNRRFMKRSGIPMLIKDYGGEERNFQCIQGTKHFCVFA